MKKKIPKFNSEAEERLFWQNNDSSEYIDWSDAEEAVFSRLKPSTKTISIRLPESMIEELKLLANKRDVPYQSLLKIFLSCGFNVHKPRLQKIFVSCIRLNDLLLFDMDQNSQLIEISIKSSRLPVFILKGTLKSHSTEDLHHHSCAQMRIQLATIVLQGL